MIVHPLDGDIIKKNEIKYNFNSWDEFLWVKEKSYFVLEIFMRNLNFSVLESVQLWIFQGGPLF